MREKPSQTRKKLLEYVASIGPMREGVEGKELTSDVGRHPDLGGGRERRR
jgi:hypothetical protein